MHRTDKQILRSRAFRALAQDDNSLHAASEAVILSAEGAKDLLRGIMNG